MTVWFLHHLNTKYCLKFIRSQCSWHYSVGSEFSVDFSNLTRQSLIRSLIILPSIAIGVKRFNTIFLPQIKNFSIIFSFLEYWKNAFLGAFGRHLNKWVAFCKRYNQPTANCDLTLLTPPFGNQTKKPLRKMRKGFWIKLCSRRKWGRKSKQ